MAERDYLDTLKQHWDSQHPDLPKEEYAFAVLLIRSGRRLEDALSKTARDFGLAGRGDYEVLAALHRVRPDGNRPADLARIAMVTTGGMTNRLDRLEKKGLVTRSHDAVDRRSVNVRITAKGSLLANHVLKASIETARDLFEFTSPGEIANASTTLKAAIKGLSEANPAEAI